MTFGLAFVLDMNMSVDTAPFSQGKYQTLQMSEKKKNISELCQMWAIKGWKRRCPFAPGIAPSSARSSSESDASHAFSNCIVSDRAMCDEPHRSRSITKSELTLICLKLIFQTHVSLLHKDLTFASEPSCSFSLKTEYYSIKVKTVLVVAA